MVGLSKQERQKRLVALLQEGYKVRKDLATELGVKAEKTIRRDIKELGERGYKFDESKDDDNRIIVKMVRAGERDKFTGLWPSLSAERSLRLFGILKKYIMSRAFLMLISKKCLW